MTQALRNETVGHDETETPADVTGTELLSGRFEYRPVRLKARIVDAFADEIDSRCHFLLAEADGETIYVAFMQKDITLESLSRFIGAEVRMTGIPCSERTTRLHQGCLLNYVRIPEIEVLSPAITDPRVLMPLEYSPTASFREISSLGLRRLTGRVLAVWNGDRLLLKDDRGEIHRVDLSGGQVLPPVGATVCVGGKPTTDLYRVNLVRALCRIEAVHETGESETAPAPSDPRRTFLEYDGRPDLNPNYHGRLLSLRGRVTESNDDDRRSSRFQIDCNGIAVTIDTVSTGLTVEKNALVEVSGVCLMEIEDWKPGTPFPKIIGVTMLLRNRSDLRVLASAPWWTPARFVTLVAALFATLLGVFIWNRSLNRLAARRGRELAREQISHAMADLKVSERTLLAAEIHDSLSQNLAGVACQLSSVRGSLDRTSTHAAERLATAERMLGSCRRELRYCLTDLRSEAMDEKFFTDAIRKTLDNLDTDAEITIRFNVPRAHVSDPTAHAILCIIRELVANAVRHGGATSVRIAGTMEHSEIRFSVTDNGCGFDPAACPGAESGHFGIAGIRDRLKRLGGELSFLPNANGGIRAEVTV